MTNAILRNLLSNALKFTSAGGQVVERQGGVITAGVRPAREQPFDLPCR
jgi:signal transduction histidine kinase